MARAALRLGVLELANLASVSATTISRFETGRTKAQPATREKLQAVFEAAGVIFIEPGDVARAGRTRGCVVVAPDEPAEDSEPADEAERPVDPITPAQCRMARALLRWKQPDLARAAGVGVSTVNSFELDHRKPIDANMAAIRTALEAAGVEFIDANGGGPGVRPKA